MTAAAIGLAVGAGVALVIGGLRRESPSAILMKPVHRHLKQARSAGRAGARWASRQAHDAADSFGPDAIRDYLESAREAIDGVVEDEVRGLKRAIRRRRKQLGL